MCERQKDRRVLILADIDDDESIAQITFELLGVGRKLAEESGAMLCAVLLGYNVRRLASELARFADEVYCLDDVSLGTFQVDLYADALEQICRSITPEIFLAGHIQSNMELAPKLAYRMGSHLITDCISLHLDNESGNLICTKPVYGDNALAAFINLGNPRMATIRPSALDPADQGQAIGAIIGFTPIIDASKARTEVVETVKSETILLDRAHAVVAGGRGLKKVEDLNLIEELTKALLKLFETVEMGASRPLVDAGWLPSSRQIGLTGVKIKPDLYMAIGISGSLQHLSGVFGAKKIVAINTDREAPIFNYSDIGVVGDYESVMLGLLTQLKELQ